MNRVKGIHLMIFGAAGLFAACTSTPDDGPVEASAAVDAKQAVKFSNEMTVPEKLLAESKAPQYARGELLVKFRDDVPAGSVAEELVSRGQGFSGLMEHGKSLDDINRKHAVREFRRVTPALNAAPAPKGRLSLQQVESIHRASRQLKVDRAKRQPSRFLDNLYRVRLEDDREDIQAVAAEYATHPDVAYAQPNYQMPVTFVPNDPLYAEQWAHQLTDAEAGWDVQTGSSDVVIAILDTGVDYTHPDLADKIWRDGMGNPGRDFVDLDDPSACFNGEDCVGMDDDPMDFNAHGTHCAGIAAAATHNAIGVAGVAHGARIMPVRGGYTASGAGGIPVGLVDTAASVAGIEYAVDNGADIISMSFGGFVQNPALSDALALAHEQGVVLVASAGNNASAARCYPAAGEHVISVAATAGDDTRAAYSNFGWWVDVAAPGGDKKSGKDTGILSTVPTTGAPGTTDPSGYNSFNGTSMAGPYVAGLAALLLSEFPTATPDEVEARILATVDPPSGMDAGLLGTGRVNINAALTASPAPFSKVSSLEVMELDGNHNGVPENDEELAVQVELKNLWTDASDVQVELVTADPDVTILQATWSLGPMAALEVRDNAASQFRLTVTGAERDETVLLGLRITTDGVTRTIPVGFPIGTVPLTEGTDIEFDVALSDRYVAFVRLDDVDDEVNIYAIDLETGAERRVTDVPEYSLTGLVMPAGLALAHDQLVWTDNRSGSADVYLYDFITEEERVVAGGEGHQRDASISNGRVAWSQQECVEDSEGNEECQDDLYMTDLTTGEVRLIAGGPGDQFLAKISGDRIVWVDGRSGEEDIYLYDLSTSTEQLLVSKSGGQRVSDFSGDILVYKNCLAPTCEQFFPDGDDSDIYALNVVTGQETLVSNTPVDQHEGRVSGHRVIWKEQREEGNPDIFMLDLDTGVETRITRAPASQYGADIHENKIIWTDQRYAASLYYTELGPRLGDVNYDSQVTIVDALLVAQRYVGLDPQPFHEEVADVNCDGAITIVDALLLSQYYVALHDRLPCSSE
jgi:thermitase